MRSKSVKRSLKILDLPQEKVQDLLRGQINGERSKMNLALAKESKNLVSVSK